MKTIGLLILLSVNVGFGQTINWVDIEDLESKMRSEPRPVLVFIHTDWCKYCAMQDNTTFKDPEVIQLMNRSYYTVRINAEDKKNIRFLNKTYGFKSTGSKSGYHELAYMLGSTKGKLNFPTTVLLSDTFQPENLWVGFMSKKELLRKIE